MEKTVQSTEHSFNIIILVDYVTAKDKYSIINIYVKAAPQVIYCI